MRKLLLLIALVAALAACGDSDAKSASDLQEPKRGENITIPDDRYHVQAPDDITVYVNVDDHPNVVRLCLDGLAFFSVSQVHSTGGPSVTRVPEWDRACHG
jgi:hypothetical protein